jgi:hypothetical protein
MSAWAATALPPAASILADQVLGRLGLAGVVDDDGEAVAGQAFGDRAANAARGAGDDRDLVAWRGSFLSLLADPRRLMKTRCPFDRLDG